MGFLRALVKAAFDLQIAWFIQLSFKGDNLLVLISGISVFNRIKITDNCEGYVCGLN